MNAPSFPFPGVSAILEQANKGETMNPASELLLANAAAIAASAAEAQDTEDLVLVLERAVEGAARAMDAGTRLDAGELAGRLDEPALARMLRTILAEGIQIFRRELPDLEGEEAVLALRKALHAAIPRPAADASEREFFRRLLQHDCQDLDEDHCRVLGLFQDLSFSLNDIVYVHDLNGTMLYLNEPGLRLTKFTSQDLLEGLSIYDLVVPEFMDLIEARLESPGAVSRAPYTNAIYTKDGDRIPLEITSRCMTHRGQICGIIGIARDLRLARRLEAEITRLNAYMDSLLKGLATGVVFLDSAAAIQDVNPAAVNLFGAPSAAMLVGMPLGAACNEAQPALGEILAAAMREGREARLHYSGVSHFGARLNCDITGIPVRTQEGHESYLVMMADLSSQEAAGRSLLRSEKLSALGEVVGGIAHEINNPLTGILGYAQLLLNSKLEPGTRTRVEHVVMETERCRRLVQNLFTFAHLDECSKSMQDVNEVVQSVLSLREYQFHVDGITVEVSLAQGLPEVPADPCDLQRVFLGFLMNSQQALNSVEKQGKRVAIKTYRRDDAVCVEFEDNGPGIPKSIQSKVFDPFFSTKGVGGGAGMGLSLAYGIISGHGGSIALESDEGQGARFIISLPIQ